MEQFTTVITVHNREPAVDILNWLKDRYTLEVNEFEADNGFTIEENAVVIVHDDDSVTSVPIGTKKTLRVEVIY